MIVIVIVIFIILCYFIYKPYHLFGATYTQEGMTNKQPALYIVSHHFGHLDTLLMTEEMRRRCLDYKMVISKNNSTVLTMLLRARYGVKSIIPPTPQNKLLRL